MQKDWGKKLTRLYVTSGWQMGRKMINAAFREFVAQGWREERDSRTGFRCLVAFDVDIGTIRRAAKKNPALIFHALTIAHDSDITEIHCGLGGKWLKANQKLSEHMGLRGPIFGFEYVRTMPSERSPLPSGRSTRRLQRKNTSGRAGKSRRAKNASTKQPATCTTPKVPAGKRSRGLKSSKPVTSVAVANRLVFHGLPAEVERCRELVLEGLPEAERAAAKYMTAGAEHYLSGTLEFTTTNEPAFRAFNRLVAQVPAVTVMLEYDDAKSGQRRLLRAVDGRIQEHRTV